MIGVFVPEANRFLCGLKRLCPTVLAIQGTCEISPEQAVLRTEINCFSELGLGSGESALEEVSRAKTVMSKGVVRFKLDCRGVMILRLAPQGQMGKGIPEMVVMRPVAGF